MPTIPAAAMAPEGMGLSDSERGEKETERNIKKGG